MAARNWKKLKVVLYPDPVLSRPATRVEAFDDALAALASRMLELMRESKGVGLAAPQVGESVQLFVCNPTGEPGDDLIFINPAFTELSGGEDREEGCLSIPGVTVTMRRALHATMTANDLEGRPLRAEGAGLMARIWQHEVDHLHGRLIVDRMSPSDEIANRRTLKQLRDDYKPPRR